MPSTQDLRRKIRSVTSTGKLTRAMQMVAASKMNKAVQAATASRAYSDLAWSVVSELANGTEYQHPLLTVRETGPDLIILFTSNRGLAGSFNAQVVRAAVRTLKPEGGIVTVSRKGLAHIRRYYSGQLVADFPESDTLPRSMDIHPIAQFAISEFMAGRYRRVLVAYNKFKSTLRQVPTIEQLLPVTPPETEVNQAIASEYRIEPDAPTVINALLRRVVPSRLYQLALDSMASEHSARMLAMRSATDNANELVDDLTLTYQWVRQANITREIIEVSSGANALAA